MATTAGKTHVFQTVIAPFLCAQSRAGRALLVVVGACYSAATHKVASSGGAWVLCSGAGNPLKPLFKSVLGLAYVVVGASDQKGAWRAQNTLKQGFRAFSWVRRAGPPRGAPSFRWGRGPSPPWGG